MVLHPLCLPVHHPVLLKTEEETKRREETGSQTREVEGTGVKRMMRNQRQRNVTARVVHPRERTGIDTTEGDPGVEVQEEGGVQVVLETESHPEDIGAGVVIETET